METLSNKKMAESVKLAAALMDLHDENPFKIRAYTAAVYVIEKMGKPFDSFSPEELEKEGLKGKMAEMLTAVVKGDPFAELEALKEKTPAGVLSILKIKGLGAKKVKSIWKELGIETPEALQAACLAGEIAKAKGFGEKTQQSILDSLAFIAQNSGKLLCSQALAMSDELLLALQQLPQALRAEAVGDVPRGLETVDCLEILIASDNFETCREALKSAFPDSVFDEVSAGPSTAKTVYKGTKTIFRFAAPGDFVCQKIRYSAAPGHLYFKQNKGVTLLEHLSAGGFADEAAAYTAWGTPYIAPELREGLKELEWAKEGRLNNLIEYSDLKGVLHNHSTYSDGKNTLREMSSFCKENGFEYFGISDHSQSAFYANGLQEARVRLQHEEIDRLNAEMYPFKTFKGIESDILNDGSLDYPNDVLATFDFVVASVHSNLGMDEEKATQRLVKAIENPYTRILGHPTGRVLLRREGYPIDYKTVIDACAANGVVIELNASPYRLDLDWRWVDLALQKGVMIAINPDAHETKGIFDMKYGAVCGRKGGLTKNMTLNALSLEGFEKWLRR